MSEHKCGNCCHYDADNKLCMAKPSLFNVEKNDTNCPMWSGCGKPDNKNCVDDNAPAESEGEDE